MWSKNKCSEITQHVYVHICWLLQMTECSLVYFIIMWPRIVGDLKSHLKVGIN